MDLGLSMVGVWTRSWTTRLEFHEHLQNKSFIRLSDFLMLKLALVYKE